MPAVGFDGTNFLVVWCAPENDLLYQVRGARVSQSGAVLDPNGFWIDYAGEYDWNTAVAFDGANYLVVWTDWLNYRDRVHTARVSPSGRVLDPIRKNVSAADGTQTVPKVCAGDTGCLVVWQDGRTGNHGWDVYCTRVGPDGVARDTMGWPVVNDPGDQGIPSLCRDGQTCMLAWASGESSKYVVRAARLTAGGVRIDTGSVSLTRQSEAEQSTAVASIDSCWLITWATASSQPGVDAARVRVDGALLDSSPLVLTRGSWVQDEPQVAGIGELFFNVWRDMRDYSSIFGSRVTPLGVILDTGGMPISTFANSQQNARTCTDGSDYLVVWQDGRNSAYDAYAARLSSLGQRLDSAFPVACGRGDQSAPAATFGDSSYLVVWNDAASSCIRARRVARTGILLDSTPMRLSGSSAPGDEPAVATDGNDYLVVWPYGSDIWGARVDKSGVLLDTTPIRVGGRLDSGEGPVAAFGGGCYLVAWIWARSDISMYYWSTRAARVSTSGFLLDSTPLALSDVEMSRQAGPCVTFDGADFVVAWMRSSDIGARRITPGGTVGTYLNVCSAPGSHETPTIAFDGTGSLVIWSDNHDGAEYKLMGARLRGDTVGTEFLVSSVGCDQLRPSVACAGANSALVVWDQQTSTVNGHSADVPRIWGKLGPFPGAIAESGPSLVDCGLRVAVFPNPFRDRIALSLSLAAGQVRLRLRVYDAGGRLVRELSAGQPTSFGCRSLVWDGTDLAGHKLPSGVYLLRVQTGSQAVTKKLVIEKAGN